MQQGLSSILSVDPSADFEVETLISPLDNDSSQNHLSSIKIDEKLAKATLQVLETGRLTPLIKEELKWKIHARRHSMGQEDVKVEFKKPKTYSLTPDEVERVQQRKEMNRLAARRFRQRKKAATGNLQEEVERLQEANAKLQKEFDSLTMEKNQILFALSQIRSPAEFPVPDGLS